MTTKYLAAGLAVAAVNVIGAPTAHAFLQFCNGTPDTAYVAISYLDRDRCSGIGEWFDEGWWSVEPNQCTFVLAGDRNYDTVYYYAEAGPRIYAGPFSTDCIPRSVFGQCEAFCTYHDVRTYGFRQLYMGNVALRVYLL